MTGQGVRWLLQCSPPRENIESERENYLYEKKKNIYTISKFKAKIKKYIQVYIQIYMQIFISTVVLVFQHGNILYYLVYLGMLVLFFRRRPSPVFR